MKYKHSGDEYTLHFSHNILAFLYVVLGIVLLIKPTELTRLFCIFLGIAALLYGGIRLFSYLRRKEYESAFQTDLILGVILIVVGVVCLVQPRIILSILPFVLGIIILLDAIGILQRSLRLRRLDYDGWWISLILALVLALFGLILIANPFETTILFVRFLGFTLLADGCFDLWGIYLYRKYL